jgi:hypothetical protein
LKEDIVIELLIFFRFDMLFFEAQERFKISQWDQCIAIIKFIQENGLFTTNGIHYIHSLPLLIRPACIFISFVYTCLDRKACCSLFLGRCHRRKGELDIAMNYLNVY